MKTKEPINDGGPAFPHTTQWDGITPAINYHGISMRDYFAAAALKVILEDPRTRIPQDYAALNAYYIADAMLKARNAR
jgi:hypothetical protein